MTIFYRSERKFLKINKNISKYAISAYGTIYIFVVWYVLTRVIQGAFDIPMLFVVTIVFTPILLVLASLLSGERKNLFTYGKGLTGEELVEKSLEQFSEEYIVFCDVKIPPNKWNIDFVVVGPTGTFALEVKSHKGLVTFFNNKLYINRHLFEKDVLLQAKSQAKDISDYIYKQIKYKIYVRPVLVFSNSYTKMTFGLKDLNGVYVINKFYLDKLFKSFPFVKWNYDKSKVIETLKNINLQII